MGNRTIHVKCWLNGPGARIAGLAWLALVACADARALDCTAATSGVAFGVYDASLPTPTDSTGSVTIRCSHIAGGAVKTYYTLALTAGNSGTFAQRQMRAGLSILNYNLFNSATRTQVWGNGTGGSTQVGGSLLVNPGKFAINEIVHPIYGRIPAQQPADAGSYSDTILVTLTF